MRVGAERMIVVVMAMMLTGVLCAIARAQETLSFSQYNQRDPDWPGELRLVRDHFALDKAQIAIARELLSGAMTEQAMQRRVYDRRRSEWERQGDTDQTGPLSTTENQRFSARRLQIEAAWLTEIREIVLSDQQRNLWTQYERARRITELLRQHTDPELLVTQLMKEAKLTPDQIAGAQSAVESHLSALDEIAHKYLAGNALWLSIRWGRAKGDLDAAERQRDESAAKLMETLKTGLRMVADSLPPEEAKTLRTLYDMREGRSEYGVERFSEAYQYSDFLKISTLTPEQVRNLEQIMERADDEMVKVVKTYRDTREKLSGDRAAYDNLRAKYRSDHRKIRRNLMAQARAALSEEQRTAFDEGKEPPVQFDDLVGRYDQEDLQWEQAEENAG
ncbi:MAG: hypothetical protein IT435_08190 [Phycisphaerales bacterium]|nr:hypothetical protein [Phycisphaerales bacterium]